MLLGDIRNNVDDLRLLAVRGWNWWLSELWPLLPRGLRARLEARPERMTVELRDESVVLGRRAGDAYEEIGSYPVDDAGAEDVKAALAGLPGMPPPDEVALRLSVGDVLFRKVQLPLGAMRDLKGILAHEMDRQSPVDPAQIYFDYRVVHKDKSAGRLDVELRLVKRASVDRAIEFCRAIGFAPAEIEFVEASEKVVGAPFVIDRSRLLRRKLRALLTPGLVALVLLLTVLTAHMALARRERAIDALARQAAQLRTEATAVEKLRSDIRDAEVRTEFLSGLKTSPLFVKTLSDVTHILPDGSWLFGLELNGNEIRIRGYSPAASDLIGLFDSSPSFTNAQFRSPLMQAPAKKLERFDLSFDVRENRQ
jgi:general secretion pathway protein L